MNKNIKILSKSIVKYLFITGLICSIIGNIILYKMSTEKSSLLLKGTYQTDIDRYKTYILLDNQNNFCRYTQEDGVLDSGTYSLTNSTYYTFYTTDGSIFYMLPSENGFGYISKEMDEIAIYNRLSSALVFYDTPNDKWPDWCTKYKENNKNQSKS